MSSGSNKSFSTLQHLLQLAYSGEEDEQEMAARELAKLVEGVSFPSVSFGPLVHALCRLVSSANLDVTIHAARAIKWLILDDALRPQANLAGAAMIICDAVKHWEDEAKCLSELLGALQTLCWDKQCVRSVLQAEVVHLLLDYMQASDQEVSVLALSTIANILSFSDTLLLQDARAIDSLRPAIPLLLEINRNAFERPQSFYSAAAIANAAAHPTLASCLKKEGGMEVCRDLVSRAEQNLHILGSRISDCAQTALYILSEGVEGEAEKASEKYRFKWGTRPAMQLKLATATRHGRLLMGCLIVWLLLVLYTFNPLLFG